MNRNQTINVLLARRADDVRRLALDDADQRARETSTFGSQAHRGARDRIEKQHDDQRRALEGLSDEQLEQALAAEPAAGDGR